MPQPQPQPHRRAELLGRVVALPDRTTAIERYLEVVTGCVPGSARELAGKMKECESCNIDLIAETIVSRKATTHRLMMALPLARSPNP